MKNRLYGLLILSIFLLGGFIYLMFREEEKIEGPEKEVKNIEEQREKVSFNKLESEKKEISKDLKISEIKEKVSNFTYFNISGEKFYFNIIGQKLELKDGETSVGVFDVVPKNEIKVTEIYGLNNNYLIEVGEKKIIYSKDFGITKKFETKLNITYSKFSEGNYVFYSKGKGSFILYKEKTEIEYSPLFNDFIFYKGGYIGIIESSDKQKKNRFSLEGSKNFVIYFNPKTREQRIIYELDFTPKKIWENNNKIFLENSQGEKFILENY